MSAASYNHWCWTGGDSSLKFLEMSIIEAQCNLPSLVGPVQSGCAGWFCSEVLSSPLCSTWLILNVKLFDPL